LTLSPDQLAMLRKAMMGVLQAGGTAAASAIKGIAVAGKTGTAQTMRNSKASGKPLYWAWFAGMAPADAPKIVVVVMFPDVEFEGSTAAGFATKIIERYLHTKVDENSIELAR
jgi:cell division protein FtsI/penicillin-binding protein 2